MGKKKDKFYKLEPETKAMIAAVRSAVEDCAATGLYGRFMGFEESHTTDDYRLTAVFDCGEYRLRLRYLPSVMLLTDNFLDIDLDYGDAGRFTLYDVFNVLEIEDFNQYYHSGFSTTGEVPGLVRELLEVVHKYDYDLRRAAEPQLLAQMKANRLADMKAVRGKHFDPNDPDGEEQEILGILPTHPMVTIVSAACCPSSPAATLAALAFFGFSRILAAAFCAMSGAVLAVIFLPSALAPLRVASSAALPMVI